MTNHLQVLETLDELETAVVGSSARPILIFKHSTTCGTSAHAYEQIGMLLSGPSLSVDVYLVSVQTVRVVSTAIAERFGIRHESPQILLIHNNQVVWHASHHRVTEDAITAALRRRLAG